MASLLDDLLKKLDAMSPDALAEITLQAQTVTANMLWVPNPGPQTEAYYCEADELYFGGEAGGGKTDLAAGLALTVHKKTLILRRLIDDARAIADRAVDIVGHSNGLNRTTLEWKLPDRRIDFAGCQLETDKQRFKGDPHDLIIFDEAADFTESQFDFIKIWCRSVNPNQRCRVVAASNPPTTSDGLWLLEKWAPWLDPKFPYPAEPGELRWYIRNEFDKEEWVDGPGEYPVGERTVKAMSRTFIRSRLSDNPELEQTGYGDRLDLLPAELREAYREGRYDLGLRDHPRQVIPTAWVLLAQKRWTKKSPDIPMTVMGVDASGGGKDPMMVSRRHDWWFDELIEIPGRDLDIKSMGKVSAAIIIVNRRNNALIILDVGGGYGSSTYEHLVENNMEVVGFNGATKSLGRTKDRFLGFVNLRSEVIWRFREALDPDQDGGSPIALPPDNVLLADLTAATFDTPTRGIRVENKEDIVSRLGRSTDRGDSVIMSWWAGQKSLAGHKMNSSNNHRPIVKTKRTRRR